MDKLQEEFFEAGKSLFGSGWIWLAEDPFAGFRLRPMRNARNPLTQGLKPLLVVDLWEHVYYIDYRNDRERFLTSTWDLINWEYVTQNLTAEHVRLPELAETWDDNQSHLQDLDGPRPRNRLLRTEREHRTQLNSTQASTRR